MVKGKNIGEIECIRKKSNISKGSSSYKFDSGDFAPDILLHNMKLRSPKLTSNLQNRTRETHSGD